MLQNRRPYFIINFMFNKNKKDKRSFLKKLTGVSDSDSSDFFSTDHEDDLVETPTDEEDSDGELAVDMYETPNDIVIQTMTAGVRPDELIISITPEMITISGKREFSHNISEENFHHQELYWGSFSRTIHLPKEIEPDMAEAEERHGLLIIRLPKLDKLKAHRVKIKST